MGSNILRDMTSLITSIDTLHEDMIHDLQFDYYGKKLATCSSDRQVKIFDIDGDQHVLSATLKFHEGPVWQVSWAHPRFGVLFASCSYDGVVLIYREMSPNNWAVIHEHKVHNASVNSISWAPHEFGLILACASSDGTVSILEYEGGIWRNLEPPISVSELGCNSVSWAPFGALRSQTPEGQRIKRLVTGSCDNCVRVWRQIEGSAGAGGWAQEPLGGPLSHSDWVRDVAWAPNTATPQNLVASCSEDRSVLIWRQTESQSEWIPSLLASFDAPVWRLSWSVAGNILAVSTGSHKVSLWKQGVDESWVEVSSAEEVATGAVGGGGR